MGMALPAALAGKLPTMVVNELERMEPDTQAEWLEEFERRRKSLTVAYITWACFGLHYGYRGRWGMQVIFWITAGGFFLWWLADAVRLPGIIGDANRDTAIEVLRDLKAIQQP